MSDRPYITLHLGRAEILVLCQALTDYINGPRSLEELRLAAGLQEVLREAVGEGCG
jgi:hypothetical protein